MKRTLLSLFLSIATLCATAQVVTKSIIIDPQSFRPVQTDALTGVNIDPIGQDYSKRDCARLKIKINRMTKEEIDGIEVKPVTNNAVMRCKTAEYDNGLIVELTAKPQTRFYLHHNEFGDSNEVTLDLEGNKEYRLEVSLNQQYPITVASNVEGAEVYLDNIYKGTTNSDYVLTIKDVLPGTYALKVVYGGATHEKAIVVSSSSVFFKQEVNIAASLPQYLVFKVSPATASIEVDGQSLEVTDGTAQILLKQGAYNYTVAAAMYHPQSGTVVVKDSKVVQSVELTPAFGYLKVEADKTIAGAQVYVDNTKIGTLPLAKSLRLKSGEHSVKVVKSKYKTFEQTVTVVDAQTSTLVPHLERNYAVVTFKVEDGTEVWVNDKHVGTGVCSSELEIGTYRVECRKESHTPTVHSLDVISVADFERIYEPLKPIYGVLNITSTPSEATVKIDGTEVGETPLMLSNILVGERKITISKEGYQTKNLTATVTKDQTKTVEATMVKGRTASTTTPTYKSSTYKKSTTSRKSSTTKTVAKKGNMFMLGFGLELGYGTASESDSYREISIPVELRIGRSDQLVNLFIGERYASRSIVEVEHLSTHWSSYAKVRFNYKRSKKNGCSPFVDVGCMYNINLPDSELESAEDFMNKNSITATAALGYGGKLSEVSCYCNYDITQTYTYNSSNLNIGLSWKLYLFSGWGKNRF